MVSIPRYMSDDEAVVVLAALEPLHYRTFSYTRGSFGDFGKLPEEIRSSIHEAIAEYRGAMEEFRVYREPVPNSDAHYYVLGVGVNSRWIALNPPISALTPHIIELAKKSTEPWSFLGELKALGLKGIGGITACLLIGGVGYFNSGSYYALFFLGVGLAMTGWAFLLSPFFHYRRGIKVAKALLAIEELKSAPPEPSLEEIIRRQGGTFGPGAPQMAQGGTAC